MGSQSFGIFLPASERCTADNGFALGRLCFDNSVPPDAYDGNACRRFGLGPVGNISSVYPHRSYGAVGRTTPAGVQESDRSAKSTSGADGV